MSELLDILDCFEPTTLKEMDSVKLMNRTDTKYTFGFNQLKEILFSIAPYYKILEVGSKRISAYETLYYDTDSLRLYNKHHSGELNRYKIRHRTYLESSIGFLEVKFKNNKGRTIKDRIKELTPPATWKGNALEFLQSKLPFDPNSLIPCLWVNYSRITLVNKHSAERLTIDVNLEFVKDSRHFTFNNLIIAEVKQEKKQPSEFINCMKRMHIREGSISKYCMGVAVTCDGVKRNNFKQKIRSLKNITGYEYSTIAD